MTLLQDVNGNTSSKRVAGFFALGVSFALTVLSFFKPVSPSLLYQWLGFASLALLGGLLEKKND
jgi:hypothetical protein